MHETLDPKDDIDRLFVSKKEGGRGHVNIEYCIEATIQGLEECAKKSKERLITAAKHSNINSYQKKKKSINKKSRNKNWKKKTIVLILRTTK